MTKPLYIPFTKILRELNKSKNDYSSIFLCHRSETFKKLWDSEHQREIKLTAIEFFQETESEELGDIFELSEKSAGSVLFNHPKGTDKNNQLKIDFLHWGAAKNRRKKRLKTT